MALIKKIEIELMPSFKIMIEGERGSRPNRFDSWRDAFAFGKKIGLPFAVLMKEFVVAAWSPKNGFHSFVAPEFILQAERQQKYAKKPQNATRAAH